MLKDRVLNFFNKKWLFRLALILCIVLFLIKIIYGNTGALYNALKFNDFDRAEKCIFFGADVDGYIMRGWKKDMKGATILTNVASYNDAEAVRFLLERGADVNKVDAFGVSPAAISAIRGDLNMIRILNQFGANYATFSNGFTPLEWAVKCEHEEAHNLIKEILQKQRESKE